MASESGPRKPSFWSIPRIPSREEEILKLKDPAYRQSTLRKLRRARWLSFLAFGILYVTLILGPSSNFALDLPWILIVLFLFLKNEQQIETILLVDLLILPAATAGEPLAPTPPPPAA